MQPIIGKALVALVAVLALSVVVSASASAEVCKKKAGSGHRVLCVGGEMVGTSKESVSVPASTEIKVGTQARVELGATTKARAEEVGIYVSCGKGETGEADIHSGGTGQASFSSFSFSGTGCKVTGVNEPTGENCEVQGGYVLMNSLAGDATLGGLGSETLTLTGDLGGGWLGEVNIIAKPGKSCYTYGGGDEKDLEMSGNPKCTLKAAETEQVEKVVVCNTEETTEVRTQPSYPAAIRFEGVMKLTGAKAGKAFSIIED
jgi:hypothetical protein